MLLNSPFLSTSHPQIQSVMNGRDRRVPYSTRCLRGNAVTEEGQVKLSIISSFPQIQSMVSRGKVGLK